MTGIFIIGGAGGVGRRLGPMLAGRGQAVGAMARKPEQLEALRPRGVTPVIADLTALDAAGLLVAAGGGLGGEFVEAAGEAGDVALPAVDLDVDAAQGLVDAFELALGLGPVGDGDRKSVV